MTERLIGIKGSMFSGKTDELIRLVNREEIAGRIVQVFKPIVDDRWGLTEKIRSHAGSEHDATLVHSSLEILGLLNEDSQIVAIDEIQFFDEHIVDVVSELLDRDIKVMFAGLPEDFRGEPFGPVPLLLSKSDDIVTLTAICTHKENGEICGQEATKTQRFIDGQPANYKDPVILVGAEELYAARCPTHHVVPGKPERKLASTQHAQKN